MTGDSGFRVSRVFHKKETYKLIIHDAGAHCHAMGFNYKGKLRPAEVLLQANGTINNIREAEALEDYLATVTL